MLCSRDRDQDGFNRTNFPLIWGYFHFIFWLCWMSTVCICMVIFTLYVLLCKCESCCEEVCRHMRVPFWLTICKHKQVPGYQYVWLITILCVFADFRDHISGRILQMTQERERPDCIVTSMSLGSFRKGHVSTIDVISIAIGKVIMFEPLWGPIFWLKEHFERERKKKKERKEGEKTTSVCVIASRTKGMIIDIEKKENLTFSSQCQLSKRFH